MAHISYAIYKTTASPAECRDAAEATSTSQERAWLAHLMLQLCLPHGLPQLVDLGVVGSLSCLLRASSLFVLAIRLLHQQNKL